MTRDDVLAAAARIEGRVVRTPVLRSAALDRRVGGRVVLKAECLQRTGSFKLRGATNAILRRVETGARSVVAYSSGNHAQAVACAAAACGLAATVFMPTDAPAAKRRGTLSWGATVHGYDRMTEDREALATGFAERHGAALIPPFEDEDVIAGQGTAALELVEQAGEPELLLVPAGGGGLVAGCGLAVACTLVYAVEPDGWDDTARSLAAGDRLTAPGGSMLCDSLLSPRPGRISFALNRERLAGALAVSDVEVLAAMRFAFEELRVVLEPGGAAGLAALLAERVAVEGRSVGVVLSGGNVDASTFERCLRDG